MKTVVFGKTKTRVGDRDLLGSGGEADVYRLRDRALKIYRPLPDAVLSRKLEKVRAFPRGLPAEVLGPEELAFDEKGAAIGFTMPLAESAVEILQLSRRAFREGKISSAEVLAIFSDLRRLLGALHAKNVYAGDLNDGNILVSLTNRKIFLIDADSMQFGAFPCEVAHEKFLDPRLYGADLCARPAFDASTDWYAFAVLLFSSLLYVHPYGGAHPKYPTLLRRAEACHSILRDDVKRPKASDDPRTLPKPLYAYFEAIFDRGARREPPADLFGARFGVIVPAALPLERRSGRCRAIRIFETRGRIFSAVVQQNKLRFLYEEGGVVRRENGEKVLDEPPSPALTFVISGDTTWIGFGSELIAIKGENVVEKKFAATFRGHPMFAASSSALYRLHDAQLYEDEAPLGGILEEQTWFRAGERAGFGFWTAGQSTFYFVFTPGQTGFYDVRLPPIRGRIIDAAVAFSGERILFSVAGDTCSRMELLDTRGKSIARLEGTSHRALAHARGKVVQGDRVMVATDDGIVALEVDPSSGTLVERALFEDTEPFVRAGDELFPAPNGALYVVSEREIRELVWEGKDPQ
jgi:hypothetical protein